ncbi:MAG TPA: chromate efflux transporter [Solirubrobacteraceae bacterium]|nr:chromate efflux transporter [Solirubrobacteraceae bacterium]
MPADRATTAPSLAEIAREWGRIGCIGFGGPPAHVALLHDLCVDRRAWLTAAEFERAIGATNLLPGPASTQLAIYCAWRLRGTRGALLGGTCFVAPGLVLILALSALFLAGSPPRWLRGAGMGAGAAVAAVALRAGLTLAVPIWARTPPGERPRVLLYALAGGLAAALTGPWLVLVLLGCGLAELGLRSLVRGAVGAHAWPALLAALPAARIARAASSAPVAQAISLSPAPATAAAAPAGVGALVWTAFKVGALAFGGGFVIVPLMQGDAVGVYHWMTHTQFLNAVALGQVTPGPVTQTVAAVGYAAAGLPGGLLAALVAFAPSFSFILLGAARFERLLIDERVRAFLSGAVPAAAGAIIGAAIPLAGAIGERWQYPILAAAAIALLSLRRGVVQTLLFAGAAGILAALLGAPIPG